MFSLFSPLFKFFCSFSLALLTEAKLLSLASISSLRALDTVNFFSLFFVPNFIFFPSPSPLSLFVALCSANFLFSKSDEGEGDGLIKLFDFKEVFLFDFKFSLFCLEN